MYETLDKETLYLTLLPLIPPHHADRHKAAQDYPRRIERDLARHFQHAIGMHPFLRRRQTLFVAPDLSGEHDLIARLRGNRVAEVGLRPTGSELFARLINLNRNAAGT